MSFTVLNTAISIVIYGLKYAISIVIYGLKYAISIIIYGLKYGYTNCLFQMILFINVVKISIIIPATHAVPAKSLIVTTDATLTRTYNSGQLPAAVNVQWEVQWECGEYAVAMQWHYSEYAVAMQCHYGKYAVAMQWHYSKYAVAMQCHYGEYAVTLQWICCGHAVTLQWICSGNAVTTTHRPTALHSRCSVATLHNILQGKQEITPLLAVTSQHALFVYIRTQ